ncbi:glycoside hydrolase domain-containing protein [Alicyclobacillus sp. ALC3]|uniref:glycoside hydrolase domain-containing protein n=1 Tax=Alicyclobacillus sp. ALC3 TaxID=2796143 RepID=UPI002378A9A2|nr:glycoside hydrolase domain-containing protein [Alicyclobacillus sp. ALC3]WDL96419.1 DUF1906 domain-containing protein [Alicyclobacillus sp. ALC3]
MQRIAQAVDRYTPFWAADCKALKAAGYEAVVYLGAKTHGWTKAVTPEELQVYLHADLRVIFNWEGLSNYRGYFSAAQGRQDALDTLTELEWLGVHPDPSIAVYYSVDYDACKTADFLVVDEYFQAIKEVLNGKFAVGVYGGISIVNYLMLSPDAKGRPDHVWQTLAWSNGVISPHAAMYQSAVDTWVAHLQVDLDEIYSDPGWYPSTGGEDMQTTKVKVNGAEFPAVVYDGSTYILWTEDRQIPGFQMKNVNGEWNFSFDKTVPTTPSTITSADIHLADGSTTTLKP